MYMYVHASNYPYVIHSVVLIIDGIKIFDKTKPTWLATDWSKQGIGYWLFHEALLPSFQ